MSKIAKTSGWISIFSNIFLFIIKYWVGIVSGSVALIADAWHTLSDSISSIVLLIGIKISSKPADKEHPFGHGRVEFVASIIIGVLSAIIGFNFLSESIVKLNNKSTVIFGTWAIIITLISIVVKEIMAQISLYAYRKTKMKSLRADAWHHRSDAISSLVILVGIFLGNYFWWIDGVLGIVVSLLIFQTTYEILKDAINPILGESPSENLIKNIDTICNEVYGESLHPHHFHVHNYGSHSEITFHIYLPPNQTIKEAHDITVKIEEIIKKRLKMVSTIHIEPFYN